MLDIEEKATWCLIDSFVNLMIVYMIIKTSRKTGLL